MSQNNLLIVLVAIVIGVLGAYSTTVHDATGEQLRASDSSMSASVSKPSLNREVVRSDEKQTLTSAEVPKSRIQRPQESQTTLDAVGRAAASVTTNKSQRSEPVNTPQKPDSPEQQSVLNAAKAFLNASKSGNPSSIARTTVDSMRQGIMARSKWVSGAGMDEYKEFGKSYVRILDSKIIGQSAEVRIAKKAEVEGTDSQYVKSRKFNRREAFVTLAKENGQWRVSGYQDGNAVWSE